MIPARHHVSFSSCIGPIGGSSTLSDGMSELDLTRASLPPASLGSCRSGHNLDTYFMAGHGRSKQHLEAVFGG